MRYKILTVLLGACLSAAAWGGCGEATGQCYYYKAGELKSQGACQVTTCAASDRYYYSQWEWKKGGNQVKLELSDPDKPMSQRRLLLNGKPAYGLDLPFKNNLFTCYGVVGSDELVCNDTGNL